MVNKLDNNIQEAKWSEIKEMDEIELYRATIPTIFKSIPLKYNTAKNLYLAFKDAQPDNIDPSVADLLHLCGESFTYGQETVDVSFFQRSYLMTLFCYIEKSKFDIEKIEDIQKLNEYLASIFQSLTKKDIKPKGTQTLKVLEIVIESTTAYSNELNIKSQIMEMPTMKQSIKEITAPKSGETKRPN